MENSKIEWCNHTANLWWGCVHVNICCDNCYATALARRYNHDIWGIDKPRKEVKTVWKLLEKLQKAAEKEGTVKRVFVGSMMDIFEKPMPLIDWNNNPIAEANSPYWTTGMLREKFFNEIVPSSPNLLFLLLTKRPSNINKYIPEAWKTNPPSNVMFGTSIGNQETANNMILHLSKVNGKKFLSIEPQIEEIDLMVKLNDGSNRLLIDVADWNINGGESGHGKRPFNPDWARKIRDDCKSKNVPFFFKKMDKVQLIPDDLMVRQYPILL